MRIKSLFLIIMLTALACGKIKPVWKTIDMGEYLIDVPNDFSLKPIRGIDSQPGVLQGKTFQLNYDYGAYNDTLVATKQEFLRKEFWKYEAIMRYLSYSKHPDVDWTETTVKLLRPSAKSDSSFAKGCDMVAYCTYKKDSFNLPVYIPQEIKDHIVKIDTVQKYYRRMVYPRPGISGTVGVYMRQAKFTGSFGTLYNSMLIAGKNLDEKQKPLAMAIISTLRPKPRK